MKIQIYKISVYAQLFMFLILCLILLSAMIFIFYFKIPLTKYSTNFTQEKFNLIKKKDTYDHVTNLLGDPLAISFDEKNNIKYLDFSQPKKFWETYNKCLITMKSNLVIDKLTYIKRD